MCIYYSRSDSSMLCETFDLKLLIYKKDLEIFLEAKINHANVKYEKEHMYFRFNKYCNTITQKDVFIARQ